MSLLLLSLCLPAHAAEVGAGLYVGPIAPLNASLEDPVGMGGVRLRYRWTDAWAVEGAFGAGGSIADPRLEVLHFLGAPTARVSPFVAAGPGLLTLGTDRKSFLLDAGAGLDAELFPVLDLRADARFRGLVGDASGAALVLGAGLQVHSARVHDGDGDGVVDDVDACPAAPEDRDEWADADGCPDPDNDGDGLVDASDTCPAAPEDVDGAQDGDGCPDPDDDGDGVPDLTDRCRAEAEDKDAFEDGDGCPDPDNDTDGIPDTSDKCMNEAEILNGYRDRDGCPDEVPAEVKKFSGKIEGIHFETGKATIKKDSFVVLDAAVAVLRQFDEVKLEVQGHTDDVGDDAKNLKLSQDRAQAVVDYLVSKGVAADRLVAKGYGETRPMVPNASAAERAQNRRVEFVLVP